MRPQATCRLCGAKLSRTFVDLGSTPLANSYPTWNELAKPEPTYPLHARVCDRCLLVQVDAVVTPEAIFSDYAYFSSYSDSWVEHARRYAKEVQRRFELGDQSLVVEVASNDGYLLQHFVAAGIPVLGVEPAANVAAVASQAGIRTEVAFFGSRTAQRLFSTQQADLVIANNVMAHVPDLDDFVEGFKCTLAPNGVITAEFPHLMKLIEGLQFDTIYHEHFSYFSLLSAERALGRHHLRVFDVEELSTHGGSLRIYACHEEAQHAECPAVATIRSQEHEHDLDNVRGYEDFGPRVDAALDQLRAFLATAKSDGMKVAAYGAAAKGNTLLNSAGVTADLISCVADRSPHKQGHFMPGSRIPIVAPEVIYEQKPEFVLVLAWNLLDEIMMQMAGISDWGGRFVVPIPELQVVQ